MSKLLGSKFKDTIVERIRKIARSITIISPYVTMPAVDELLKALPDSVKKLQLITVPPGVEYVNGSVDVNSLDKLKQMGFDIRYLPELHAKIYLLDDHQAFIGSANLTGNGWGVSGAEAKGNVEDMIEIEMNKSDRDHIKARYIVPSRELRLDGDWRREVEKQRQLFQKEYTKLLNSVVFQYTDRDDLKEYMFFSDYKLPPKGFKYYFRFAIAKATWQKIKKEKSGIFLQLGGEKQAPHASIRIPFSKFGKYLTAKYTKEKRQDWQFGIYVDNEQNISMKVEDVIIPIPQKDLSGILKVKVEVIKKAK